MRDKIDNILNGGECISEKMMLKYLEDNVTSIEQHLIEKHFLECEFCSDALAGLTSSDRLKVRTDLGGLDKKIEARINRGTGKPIPFRRVYRIAAVLALIAVFGGGLYYLQSIKKSERIFTENFTPYRDTAQSTVIITPPAKPRLENDVEKIPSTSFEQEKKAQSKKENRVKYKWNDSTTQSFSVTSKDDESQAHRYSVKTNENVSASIPTQENNLDKPVAADNVQAKKKVADESKNPNTVSRNMDDATELKEEEYNADKSRAKTSKLEKPATTALSSGSTSASENTNSWSFGLIQQAKKEYDSKNYSTAVTLLQDVLKKEPGNTEALFYCGISQLSMNEDTDAIHLFQSVLKNSPNGFSEAAKWYLSLGYIKKNKASKAKKLLEDLSRGNSEYKSNAQKTLDELK